MRQDELDKILREYSLSETNHKKNIFGDYAYMPYVYDDEHHKIYSFYFSNHLPHNTVTILKNERFAACLLYTSCH